MKFIRAFDDIFSTFRPHFHRIETYERARALAYSSLVTYGRRSITRLICSRNKQQDDWSADYKFFSLREWNAADLFLDIFKECDRHCFWYQNAVLVALDETIRQKTGKKIPGVATLRDPMSLPYHVNLKPGLRYLQAACLITPEKQLETYRAIPIYFEEAAPAKKPKKNAPEEVKELYQKEKKKKRISVKGHKAALSIRKQTDQLPDGHNRLLFISVDGSFCNRYFLRDLPENVIPIARTRKDIKLFKPADPNVSGGAGRRRVYGERLPTPEEIRKDDAFPWQTARVFSAGKWHTVRYKTVAPVLWQRGTLGKPCRLIIIAPLAYRKSKKSTLLYREPAYLLLPNVDLPVEQLLQFYFLRWDIEVNHRDEKTTLGVGDAQVRSPRSVERNPQFAIAVYSLLLLAGVRAYGAKRTDEYVALPKWRKQTERRPSTLDLVAQFRREIMIEQLKQDRQQQNRQGTKNKRRCKRPCSRSKARKMGFGVDKNNTQSAFNLPVNIISAMLYADA